MLKHFTGSHTYKADAKGRVSLPAEFRRVLEAQESSGFIYLVPQMDDPRAHVCFTVRGYDQLIARHYAAEYESPEEELEMEVRLLTQARQVPVDDVGRIVLNEGERADLGIDKDVRFVGLGASFEIWEPGARAAFEADLRARRPSGGRRIDRRGLHG